MSGITLTNHFALQNFQGGKERGGAMSREIMGEGAATASFLSGKPGWAWPRA